MSQQSSFSSSILDDDDDFENPTPILSLTQKVASQSARTTSLNSSSLRKRNSTKKLKLSSNPCPGKENQQPLSSNYHNQIVDSSPFDPSLGDLSLVPSSLDCSFNVCNTFDEVTELDEKKETKLAFDKSYLCNSIESRLLNSSTEAFEEFEPGTQLNELVRLCSEEEEKDNDDAREDRQVSDCGLVLCPLCETDISELNEELRQLHTNDCLDKREPPSVLGTEERIVEPAAGSASFPNTEEVVDVSPVLDWLRGLELAKYEEVFVREEIDWDTLQWLTEEDLFNIGISTLGPRKKILHALNELRQGNTHAKETRENMHVSSDTRPQSFRGRHVDADVSRVQVDESNKLIANKLITDYFPAPVANMNKSLPTSGQQISKKISSDSSKKRIAAKGPSRNRKVREVPTWCTIPGTTFRVDAFQYLSRDCSHWFLTHFHLDHYQGLAKSFSHGKVYCSLITAKLVNMKIGIAWDRLHVLPLNEKINIAGTGVTCLDANHCPGSIIILFEPPNGKAILHTGDFRFSDEMTRMPVFQICRIHTLILDTTYCDPQYNFPKQEAVIQFVIEAIQAETFNEKTLFLIGSYTIGKERLYLEVARVLHRKVYVSATKLLILKCLGFSAEDMNWFTSNEEESHIHVVPMWMLASFKRLKQVSNHYANRFNLIVAFSPTGWTFGKGKKKSLGRRWQQGTLIRYEVPYSEHSSFTELKEFVKFISPLNILPSVNNNGPESVSAMTSLLLAQYRT